VSERRRGARPVRRARARSPRKLPTGAQTGGGRDHRRSSSVDGIDDLRVVDPLEIDRGHPEMGMPELALDDDQRHALVGHLDRVRVPELMGREPAPDSRCDGGPAQLSARGRRLPVASGGRALDHAEQRADRELDAELLPWLELLPGSIG
jgi:hypothetical protein